MRKTWRLVYNYLLTFIGSFISKRRNARFAVGVLFVLGIGALMVFLFTNTAIATTVKFAQLGVPELAMYSNSFMAILIILFLTVMRSALPAKTTDEQLLLSLPIKKTQIILAKSLFNYLFDFLSLLGILFPSYIVYAVINRAGITLVFRGLLITALQRHRFTWRMMKKFPSMSGLMKRGRVIRACSLPMSWLSTVYRIQLLPITLVAF